ncbi:hypothetical protein [Rhodococcus ruber]|uniref:DUF7352 domain-containing protein n=1 Tax=Rhodococcus ruber TaxID=1830 RepID=UPI00065F78EA|nr:hypothetical protein [Rhodococcus ruber]
MRTRTIHRVNFEITDTVTVDLPSGARLLHVAPCREHPDRRIDLWYECRAGVPARPHTLHVEGTGHPIVDDALYIGTVVASNGLVWHVYLDARLAREVVLP